jgi:imidazolonepropionase-like amidohydrolase
MSCISRLIPWALALLLGGWAVPTAAQERPLALVGGTLIDGTGTEPVGDSAIVLRDGRIEAAGLRSEVVIPMDAEAIDVSGKWIIPGLIDAHVHFFQSGGLYTRPDIIDLRSVRPYEEELAAIRRKLPASLARYVASGVTGVIDIGGPIWTYEVRDLARSTSPAPRVAVAGPLLATYVPPQLEDVADPPMLRIETPEEARASVRRLLAHKPDLIKVWFVRPRRDLKEQIAWVEAAIAESHAAGVPVAVHATQERVARAVIDAGADILAHSIDDRRIGTEMADRIAAQRVIYVTTLVVNEGYREVLGGRVELTEIERQLGDREAIASWDDVSDLPARLAPRSPAAPQPAVDPEMAANLIALQQAGAIIAAGSDAGNIGTLHGPALHRELELMVEAGLTPMQALVAATRGGAAAMGRADELGTIEPGKLADMVVLDADPTANIRNTRRIDRVFVGGEMFNPDAIESTLRRHPHGCPRMTRGHCGLLDLQCSGLAPPAPRRFDRRT